MRNKKNILIIVSLFTIAVFTIVGGNFIKNANKNEVSSKTNLKATASKTIIIDGDYQHYRDIQSISKSADVIVKGEVVKVNTPQSIKIADIFNNDTQKYEAEYQVYTVSNIKVTKVIKGNVKESDIIQVKQIGGAIGNTTYKEVEATYLQPNEDHIFFLQQYDNVPYSMLNPTQGKIRVEKNKVKANNDKIVENDSDVADVISKIEKALQK